MALVTFNPSLKQTRSNPKPEVKILSAEFGDGYTQESPDGSNHIRIMATLEWDVLTDEQIAELVAFFQGQGGYKPFYYALRDGVVRRWTCKDWDPQYDTINKFKATLREYFGLET